jgi:hypothetical protein
MEIGVVALKVMKACVSLLHHSIPQAQGGRLQTKDQLLNYCRKGRIITTGIGFFSDCP